MDGGRVGGGWLEEAEHLFDRKPKRVRPTRSQAARLKRAHRRKRGGTLKEVLAGTGLPTRGRPVKKERVRAVSPLRKAQAASAAARRREQEARNRAFSP